MKFEIEFTKKEIPTRQISPNLPEVTFTQINKYEKEQRYAGYVPGKGWTIWTETQIRRYAFENRKTIDYGEDEEDYKTLWVH